MSSFLCFICHNTVNSDTTEETREKYREVVGMNLCPDSHLCYICYHMLNKLWLFKSICLKRSLEYPVLFSEKGTIYLQRHKIEAVIICNEENCLPTNISQVYADNRDHSTHSNDYTKLEKGHNDYDEYFHEEIAKESEIDRIEDFEQSDRQIKNDMFLKNEMVEVNDEMVQENDETVNDNNEMVKENDEMVGNNDAELAKNDEEFVKKDECLENDDGCYSNENHFNDAVNKEADTELKEQSEDEINYEEEYNECLDEIRNEIGSGDAGKLDTAKKKKTKKSEKKGFEKILLSSEEQKAELEAQRKSKKYLESEFKCHNCALGFLFKDTYQTHMMRHEESNGEYVCMLCSLRFASGAVLRSHSALHAVRYRCLRCDHCVRARQTRTHARCCHETPSAATCHLCGRVFQDPSGLQQHLKRFHMTKTSNRIYSCSVCEKTYNNQAAVRTHMIKHIHRKFSCDECPAIFSSPYTLTQHKKKHSTEQKQHYCVSCGLAYSCRKSLLAHQRTSANHQQTAYECPICNRSCPNERSLTSHISTVHSVTKQFHCPTCNAKYSSRKSLTRHVRGHTTPPQTKVAVCHLCGNSFKGKSKLNRHLREVCEKDKLEEELSSYYEQQHVI